MFPRSSLLVLPLVVALGLSTGACGVPLALTAASYAGDGVLVATTDKTSGDHFASMVTKDDCSFWRVFRHQAICKPREGNQDPYKVNYDEPYRAQSEGGGVQYGPPLHAAPDAPASSWDAAAYKPAPTPPAPVEPTTAIADATAPPTPVAAVAAPPAAPKKKSVGRSKAKKPSPGQVASAR